MTGVASGQPETQNPDMQYILALDQGTTSSRAIVFDRNGRVASVAQKEFRQLFPQPGWVEHDPADIWASQLNTARKALRDAGLTAKSIAAIGITNQRETTIVWDRTTGRPICNAIVWQDRRTAPYCDKLKSRGLAPLVRRKTGLALDAYFSATKLQWILRKIPGAMARARAGQLAFGTVDSWLVWKLTAGRCHVTDASNASRTMLFNLQSGDWDEELLQLFGVPRHLLPEVRSSSEVYGQTELFGHPIPIAGLAGDQQAALFGQNCTRPGLAKNTYGTGCFLLMHTGARLIRSRNQMLTTVAWRLGSRTEYALEGSVFTTGAVVQWLRDNLGFFKRSAEVETLAAQAADNGGVYLVPAFVGLGAPHWDAYARGLVIGLTRGSNRAHLARAALESIAYQVADVVQAMEKDAGIRLQELRVDGGGCVNNLLMQFQADILGVPLSRPTVTETTALGAAYLAGLAVGFWQDQNEIASKQIIGQRFVPALRKSAREALIHNWRRALKRSRAWASHA